MTEIDVTGFDEVGFAHLDLVALGAPDLEAALDASLGPAVVEELPTVAGAPDPVVVTLVAALSRSRGLAEDAVALAHPLHAPGVADRLVLDLARCRGTSEQVVRLTFGLSVTGTW
jgi:hypothetical protein